MDRRSARRRGLIINTGDMLRRWTNDRWCSNQHRVLPPPASNPAEELISLVFFHEPDDDALIEAPRAVSTTTTLRSMRPSRPTTIWPSR